MFNLFKSKPKDKETKELIKQLPEQRLMSPLGAVIAINAVTENFANLQAMANVLVESGLLPQHIKTPEQAVAIMIKGVELNIPPTLALANIYVVNGMPAIQGKLMLALIYRAGGKIKILKESSSECEIEFPRKGKVTYTARYTTQDAQRAGLLSKDNWKKYPIIMLKWRAISIGANTQWPDILGGMLLPDEVESDKINIEDAVVLEDKPKIQVISQQKKDALLEAMELLSNEDKDAVTSFLGKKGGIDAFTDTQAQELINNINNKLDKEN